MIRRSACLLVLLATAACAHSRDQRLAAAVDAALARFDPAREAVIVVRELKDLSRARELVGGRRVATQAQIVTAHPDQRFPANILFESAEWKGTAVHLRIHVPGVARTPPEGVMACGTGFLMEVKQVNGRWMMKDLETTVC